MDFVFYQDKQTRKIKVVSFMEQNDSFMIQIDVVEETLQLENASNIEEGEGSKSHHNPTFSQSA